MLYDKIQRSIYRFKKEHGKEAEVVFLTHSEYADICRYKFTSGKQLIRGDGIDYLYGMIVVVMQRPKPIDSYFCPMFFKFELDALLQEFELEHKEYYILPRVRFCENGKLEAFKEDKVHFFLIDSYHSEVNSLSFKMEMEKQKKEAEQIKASIVEVSKITPERIEDIRNQLLRIY